MFQHLEPHPADGTTAAVISHPSTVRPF